ncbi:fasciclin domain protein [gut metagenome]|uniref:Fasciclin domain protein n=1 Tax=gut metagenome TaxID=749906 RepID=J9FW13_9ZZZZ
MNTRKLNMKHWVALFASALLIASPVGITSCKEDISEDAYAVKQKDSMMDYITKNDSLSMIKRIFDEVQLGNSTDASSLSSVLSARGNYTVFAPDNKAITAYLTAKGFNSLNVDSVAEPERKKALVELKKHIALSCVIDNGTTTAYELADLTGFSGTIPITNLSNRFLDIKEVDGEIVINVDSRIKVPNVEVSNGMCHVVDKVIAPSIQNLATLIKAADNMRTMGTLLEVTGWADSFTVEDQGRNGFSNQAY